jgi:crossover junction endodeoxyribonuclease RuvC
MQICGIDPGLRSTGWGIVRFENNRMFWVADGMIKPDPDAVMADRLNHIHMDLKNILAQYRPDRVAIEEIFVSRNAASALKLGMARGVAMVAASDAGLPVDEISARRIKQNVTGSGRADKQQVTAMVSRLLNITPSGVDAADALATAISLSHDDLVTNGLDIAVMKTPDDKNAGKKDKDALSAAISLALSKERLSS